MECPICSEVFNESPNCPRLLNCGHTCCEDCLNQVIVDTQITCPTCRSISVAPSPANLPKNYIVLEFIANKKSTEKPTGTRAKFSSKCEKHPEETVIRYCIEDSLPLCADCILDHGGHKLVKLDDPVLELRFEVKGLVENVKEMLQTTEEKKQDVLGKKQSIGQAVMREIDRIDSSFAAIYEKLEARKNELKKKIEVQAMDCENKINDDMEALEDFSEQLQQYLAKLQALSNTIVSMSTKELANSSEWAQRITISKREVHVLFSNCQKLGTLDPSSLFSSKTLFNTKPLEQEISKFGVVSLGGDMLNPTIYCFGTQNTVLKFHLGTQRWSQTVIQEPNGYEFKNFASIAALPNGNILITGGTKSNEVYEYTEGKMIKRCNMLHVRSSHNAVYHNGFVYCIGGYNGSSWHDKCEKISIETNSPMPIASLNYKRCAFSSCVAGNCIYVFGGYDGSKYLDNIERYNVTKNKWEVLPCVLHRPLQNTGAACYSENKIMIAGGYNEKGTLNLVRSLDLETLEWTNLPNMNFTRYLMNKFHCCGGCVFAIGGTAQGQNIEYYNVSEGRWICLRSYRELTEDTMYKWAAVITDEPH